MALSKVIWVADHGFTSEANRRALMQGGGGYIGPPRQVWRLLCLRTVMPQ